MADDKSKDEKEETGGIKKNLSDEFDEAAGKGRDESREEETEGGNSPGGMKDKLSDEFDEATGERKDRKKSERQEEREDGNS